MNLTENFTLEELTKSSSANSREDLLKKQQNPPQQVVDNLKLLCKNVLQPLRDTLNYPITITSGYRCEEVNKLV